MKKTVVVLGTMDTKGVEFGYLVDHIQARGVDTIVVDTGSRGHPLLQPDISREEVASAAGVTIDQVANAGGEANAIEMMARGASKIVMDLYKEGKMDGIISLGGSLGTTMGTAVMRDLPFGVPKLMVSTIASGDTRNYVGTKDITMMYPITDIIGLNRMTKRVLANAAGAIAGMVESEVEDEEVTRPLIGLTTLGAMRCVLHARESLENLGYEGVVFHTVGSGGRSLETLIDEGLIDGVLDLATNELGNHLFGGALDAGPNRLEAAGRRGIPQVVGPGIIDIISITPPEAVPERFKDRDIVRHNPYMVVVPLDKDEMMWVAKVMADKLNRATGPTAVIMPNKGFSPGGREGRRFHDRERDELFIKTLRENLRPEIDFIELDAYINDSEVSEKAVSLLVKMMEKREAGQTSSSEAKST